MQDNKWFERIKKFYEKGYYTEDEVRKFVPKMISQEECEVIIGK